MSNEEKPLCFARGVQTCQLLEEAVKKFEETLKLLPNEKVSEDVVADLFGDADEQLHLIEDAMIPECLPSDTYENAKELLDVTRHSYQTDPNGPTTQFHIDDKTVTSAIKNTKQLKRMLNPFESLAEEILASPELRKVIGKTK